MRQYIILIPVFFVILFSLKKTPEKVFFAIYLPVLLLLPQNYHLDLKGFPDLGFAQWAILAMVPFAFRKIVRNWKFTIVDVTVLGYYLCCVISEYTVSGEKDGRNLAFQFACNSLLPYIFAKAFIYREGFSTRFAKRFSFLMFINVIISLYEARFTSNPYLVIFSKFFPAQDEAWPVLFRSGLTRISGPMIQTILYGACISIAILLTVWLIRKKIWEHRFNYVGVAIPDFSILRKGYIILGVLLLGLFLTFSRGPWGGTLIGWMVMGIGFSNKRWLSFAARCIVMAIIGILIVQKIQQGIGISPYMAESNQQATTAYRAIMVSKYWTKAVVRPIWGYSSQNVPNLIGVKSIDNQYLWLLIKHGFPALAFFMAMIFISMLRLFYRGMTNPISVQFDTSLTFTLLGCLAAMCIALAIVYMGLQTRNVLFLLIGWADGLMICAPKTIDEKDPLAYRVA